MRKKFFRTLIFSVFLSFCLFLCGFAQESKEPITVNGDNVEYSTDNKEVTARGNVSINYKDAKLSCEKITVNTDTKDARASGNIRLEDPKGVIEGKSMKYNLSSKIGTILDADFRSSPYFGKADELDKVSDSEYVVNRGYATTCDYGHPHYRFRAKKMNFFPNDKIQIKGVKITAGQYKEVPFAYLPSYTRTFRDPFMHVQLQPGHRKGWGYYMLSAWRYELADDIKGRIYADYRQNLGAAEGFGTNYDTKKAGKGDFKFYYTQERDRTLPESSPAEFERYLVRLRHKWDIDNRTNLIGEFHKIGDQRREKLGDQFNFLKDYFPREYEKDSQPISYFSAHRSFDYSGLDFIAEKRVNKWYSETEKLPEATYTMPSIQIAESPFYFSDTTSYSNLDSKSPGAPDIGINKLDTTNRFSLPTKVAFVQVTPFVSSRQTFFDRDAAGDSLWDSPRTVFSTGADASTKFYRIFDVKTDLWGLDINGLRHIITPSVGYVFQHAPTIPSRRLRLEGTITTGNSAALELSNKLQTKRNKASVDLADFRVNTTYNFKTGDDNKRTGKLSDILFNLNLLPYAWLTLDADTTYQHSGSRSDPNYNHFSNANYDLNFNFGAERSFGIGQRLQRKGSNEITNNLAWRFSPKWKFTLYQRRNITNTSTVPSGLREQEYILTRDLHCWEVGFTYNIKRNEGESIWLVFRLKAFPENELSYNQTYHQPKPGSQSNY